MIYAKDINEHTPWQDLTPGAEIYEPGTARYFNTGTWRFFTLEFVQTYKVCLRVYKTVIGIKTFGGFFVFKNRYRNK